MGKDDCKRVGNFVDGDAHVNARVMAMDLGSSKTYKAIYTFLSPRGLGSF